LYCVCSVPKSSRVLANDRKTALRRAVQKLDSLKALRENYARKH
jgi:hypothetical protein